MAEHNMARDSVLTLARGRIHRNSLAVEEEERLREYVASFSDLPNPIYVRCEVRGHRSGGGFVFPDEVAEGTLAGKNVRFEGGRWICTFCGDDQNVECKTVEVVPA